MSINQSIPPPSSSPSPSSSSASSCSFFTDLRSRMRSFCWTLRTKWIPSSYQQLADAEQRLLSSLSNQNYSQYFTPIEVSLSQYDQYNQQSNNPLVINTVHFSEKYNKNNKNFVSPPSIPSLSTNNNNTTTPYNNHITTPLLDRSSITGERHATLLLHGYGAGLPLWIRNYDFLSRLFPSLYSIDWLGVGRSSRPPFLPRGVDQTEEYFISSIESWRKAHNIDKLTLIGHSMGGYFSSIYSIRYPERIERLILVSPAGVPPYDPAAVERFAARGGIGFGLMVKLFRYLYTSGVSPHDLVRLMGPWGRVPVRGYVYNRFMTGKDESFGRNRQQQLSSNNNNDNNNNNEEEEKKLIDHDQKQIHQWTNQYLKEEESKEELIEEKINKGLDKEALTDYCYHNLALERSSERSLSELFRPPVYAYRPLIDRLPSIVIQYQFPVHFIYGYHDWMDPSAGLSIVSLIQKGTGNKNSASIHLVKNAGHQLFIDNPAGFHGALLDAINNK